MTKFDEKGRSYDHAINELKLIIRVLATEEKIKTETANMLLENLKILMTSFPLMSDFFEHLTTSQLTKGTELNSRSASARPEIIFSGKWADLFITIKPLNQ